MVGLLVVLSSINVSCIALNEDGVKISIPF